MKRIIYPFIGVGILFLLSLSSCRLTSEYSDANVNDAIVIDKYTKTITDTNPATWGPVNTHDPKLFQDDDGTYYVFSTDASIGNTWQGGIQVRKSKDLINWECLSTPALGKWDEDLKSWCGFTSDDAAYTWAPTVIKFNGKYYMYHGVIVDVADNASRPRAWIGLAIADKVTGPYLPAHEYDPSTYTSSTVVRYTFTRTSGTIDADCLNEGAGSWSKGFGAIDPEIIWDANGDMWMTYGSWKGGIAILRLNNNTGMPLNGYPADTISGGYGTQIAGGNGVASEGACLFRYGDYYYLFYSLGDLGYDYSVRVGRRPVSQGIAGPYYDASGKDLTTLTWNDSHQYGNKILGAHQFSGEYGWRCPGGQSILVAQNGKIFMAHHTRTNFKQSWWFYLQVRQLYFTEDGWPVVNPNEYYGETLRTMTAQEVSGSYKVIHTIRGATWAKFTNYEGVQSSSNVNSEDANETLSVAITLNSDGTVSGAYTGTWSVSGSNITIILKTTSGSSIGTYKGIVSEAVDWARKDNTNRKTITFTTFCPETGEYFFGNKD
jgi:arabinan endo-1,5-alpha-L-arabinosidase